MFKGEWEKEFENSDHSNHLASISRSLAIVTSYFGQYEKRFENFPMLIMRGVEKQEPRAIIAQSLLQNPFILTLTLEQVLRFKPKLWSQIRESLGNKGLRGKSQGKGIDKDASTLAQKSFCKSINYAKVKGIRIILL